MPLNTEFLAICTYFPMHLNSRFVSSTLWATFNFQVKEKELKRIMTRIFCQSIHDIFMLLDVLHQLELALKVISVEKEEEIFDISRLYIEH